MKLRLPLFILFEGIDGSGKTTLSDTVYHHFASMGIPAVKLVEPTDGIWGMQIREMLQEADAPSAEKQLELFLKDREDDVTRNIIPSLNSNMMVVMDRYYYSTAAYQGAMGLEPDHIISENVKRGFPKPDRVYLIDVAPEHCIQRIARRRSGSAEEQFFEKKQFLEKVRALYLTLADESFCILDGEESVETLRQQVILDIERNFGIE